MAQLEKSLATTTEDMILGPTKWKEIINSYKLSSDMHIFVVAHLHVYSYI